MLPRTASTLEPTLRQPMNDAEPLYMYITGVLDAETRNARAFLARLLGR